MESNDVYVLPASFDQERFWALDRLNPGNPTWNLPVRFRLEGALDPSLVECAFNEIVRRHEVLRTIFRVADGHLHQEIAPSLKLQLAVIDLRHLAKAERDAEVDRLSLEEAHRRFDLAVGPLFRVGMLRTAENEHVLLVTPHHSVADYWSIGLISNELGILYEAYSRGLESPLPENSIQYGDYAVWQREQSASPVVQRELEYWKKQLEDLRLVEFPTDRARPAFPTYNATITSILLPVELTDAIKAIANREGATFFNIMLTALAMMLHQYTGQVDFGVATQIAGRNSVELETLIGLFINTVILRADLSGTPTFTQLLNRINDTGMRSLANQNLRFEELLKELRPADYPSHHTLFRVNFICQRDPVKPLEFSGIKLTVIPSKSQGALYDLNIFLVLRNEGWRLACEYNTDLFEAATITRLLENYRALLAMIVENPDRRISEFPRLDIPASLESPRDLPPLSESPTDANEGPDFAACGPASDITSNAEESSSAAVDDDTYAFPITIAQRSFWRLEELMPGNGAMNMQATLRLTGAFDIAVLQRCLDELIRRHEALRTTFETSAGRPIQVIHPRMEVSVDLITLQELAEPERESRAQELLHEEASRPFVLPTGPLLRVTVLQLGMDDCLLTITLSHLVCDGWSSGILVRELTALYETFSQGQQSALPEPTIRYADFAHWQSERMKDGTLDRDLAYWKNQLKGDLTPLDLPVDRPVQPALVSRASTEILTLSPEFATVLKEFCKREQLTLFMLLLSVFKVLLYRYTGQEDIIVSSPAAGRQPEVEGVVGLFSYPISLRTDLSGDPTFRELAGRVRRTALEALAHKDLPFGHLVEEMSADHSRGVSSLLQIYFLHQFAFLQSVRTPGLLWTPLTWLSPAAPFDLHLATLERDNGVVVRLEYNAEMFEPDTIRRVLKHFRTLLDSALADPETRIAQLAMLEAEEAAPAPPLRVSSESERPAAQSVLELFEAKVRSEPGALAAISARESLTYREVDSKANTLAALLAEFDLSAERLVGICCDLSAALMIGGLAALKCGAAFVWVPPSSVRDGSVPRALEGTVGVMLAERDLNNGFSRAGMPVLNIRMNESRGADASPDTRMPDRAGEQLACVRLTSGSSGEPKAVAITHKALLERAQSCAQAYGFAASDRVALLKSGAALETIFAALITGAAAIFAPPEVVASERAFLRFVKKSRCDVLVLSTRFWRRAIASCEGTRKFANRDLRLVAIFGECPTPALSVEFARLTDNSVNLMIGYGTAETGPAVAFLEPARPSPAAHSGSVVAASSDSRLSLVDRNLQPVPVGVTGEICVEGEGLARGYLNNPQLEVSTFVHIDGEHKRVFKTGDLGRRLPGGEIEFIGPACQQLKLRGFRLRLGLLETVLMRHHAVRDVVAVPSENGSGGARAVAYVAINSLVAGKASAQRDANLRRQLWTLARENCPDHAHMLAVIPLDDVPLDANGNADRRALPAFDTADDLGVRGSVTPPRDDVERRLVEIWQQILGVEPIGITDSFFELNGQSLAAMRLLTKINAVWRKNLALSTLIGAPTIEGLAKLVRGETAVAPSSSLVTLRSEGSMPALYLIAPVGNAIAFHGLVKWLGSDQPVYALEPPGADGVQPYLTRLEHLAAHYLQEIKARQPQGPYCLMGYSFGGLVAYEMAQQLAKRGDQVGLLAMLDTHYSGVLAGKGRFATLHRLRRSLSRVIFGPDRLEHLEYSLRSKFSKLIYRTYDSRGRTVPQSLGYIIDINTLATATYTAEVYPGILTLLLTDSYPPAMRRGWESLAAGGVSVHQMPGNHYNLTREPNVRVLAEALSNCLAQARSAGIKTDRLSHSHSGLETGSNAQPLHRYPEGVPQLAESYQ